MCSGAEAAYPYGYSVTTQRGGGCGWRWVWLAVGVAGGGCGWRWVWLAAVAGVGEAGELGPGSWGRGVGAGELGPVVGHRRAGRGSDGHQAGAAVPGREHRRASGESRSAGPRASTGIRREPQCRAENSDGDAGGNAWARVPMRRGFAPSLTPPPTWAMLSGKGFRTFWMDRNSLRSMACNSTPVLLLW